MSTTGKPARCHVRTATARARGYPPLAGGDGGLIHPALTASLGPVPTLTLVLPSSLAKDQVLAGLAAAISRARASLAANVQLFQHLAGHYAARGDGLHQAQSHGHALATENAAGTLDEAVIEVFGLWVQYEAQIPPCGPDPLPGLDPLAGLDAGA